MPLAGTRTRPHPYPLYFETLNALDQWRATVAEPVDYSEGVLKYVPRKLRPADSVGKGKLLVSHDFKNNYVEDPFLKSYTFNWWTSTDHFNYFSHRRVTLPPPEWITAAHRAGTTMLGTIIFEGGSELDLLRMIMGRVPGVDAAEVEKQPNTTLPLSPYYAELFADIAAERGFDGYLLNIEIGLGLGAEQARALAAWITILQNEMIKKVGPHVQTIWYDSVTIRGDLWWQDRLNSLNLPFFLQSSGIFTNYWWYNDAPAKQIAYFNTIDPNLTGQTADPHPQALKRTIQDVYVGIDIWGRGSHGGGGFGAYRALDHIAPMTLGLSCAIFGQGWTWESEEGEPGWNWDSFWNYDSSLWVGPVVPGSVTVPPLEFKGGETPCVHGPFTPISSYFPHLPPPEPHDLPFYTNFCPGIGDSWFVEGCRVWTSNRGWTDMDKQTLVGDLIWPRPRISRLDGRPDTAPIGTTRLNMADAWNGGNSVGITISIPGSEDAYSALWVPIQTLNLTSRRKYEATAVYKTQNESDIETELALGFRSASGEDLMTIITSTTIELANGWQKAIVQFEISTPPADGQILMQGQLGLIVAAVIGDPSPAVEIPFLIGQLSVYPSIPESYKEYDLTQHWIYFEPESSATPLNGTLNWEVAVAFDPVPPITIINPEDPRVAWNLQPTREWFPKFLYFNVYAQQLPDGPGTPSGPFTWVGTTTYINIGDRKTFYVLEENLPYSSGQRRYEFKVQPVLETGEVYSKWVSFKSASVTGGATIEDAPSQVQEVLSGSSGETGSTQESLVQKGGSPKPKRKSSVTAILGRLRISKGDKDKGDGATSPK